MQQQIDFLLRREQLEQVLNDLIDINARDRAFLRVQDPDPAEVAGWTSRRDRVVQIFEEFQALVHDFREA